MNATTASYQIVFLGADSPLVVSLASALMSAIADIGLPGDSIAFYNEGNAADRDLSKPAMGIYIGSEDRATDTDLVTELIEDGTIIAPIVSDAGRVHAEIPPQLRHINALARGKSNEVLPRLVNLVLETFRLLRRERRLFISYKRTGSQPLADLLYDALDARGFDVFIDVRSVPPAADFQSQLWHRMSDADVVILIDTPGFREGRWTAAELAQANATNIQILHLLWPGQTEDAGSSFSHFLKLEWQDFWTIRPLRGKFTKAASIKRICDEAERLRARAIAARHRYLVDNFCDAARDINLDPAVQVDGWISLEINGGKKLAVIPAVGVPTSDRINDLFVAISDPAMSRDQIWVIYDNRGVLGSWLDHLDWLDNHLPIRTVQMAKAPQLLAEAVA